MKYFMLSMILEFFVLLSQPLLAMHDATNYNKEKTTALKYYLNKLVSSCEYNIKPETIDLALSVTKLVEDGADPRVTTDLILAGYSAIHFAAHTNDIKLIKYLLSHGAEVNQRDKTGSTALFIAAFAGHQEVVTLLIESGARVDLKDNYGETPLSYSCFAGHKLLGLN